MTDWMPHWLTHGWGLMVWTYATWAMVGWWARGRWERRKSRKASSVTFRMDNADNRYTRTGEKFTWKRPTDRESS